MICFMTFCASWRHSPINQLCDLYGVQQWNTLLLEECKVQLLIIRRKPSYIWTSFHVILEFLCSRPQSQNIMFSWYVIWSIFVKWIRYLQKLPLINHLFFLVVLQKILIDQSWINSLTKLVYIECILLLNYMLR